MANNITVGTFNKKKKKEFDFGGNNASNTPRFKSIAKLLAYNQIAFSPEVKRLSEVQRLSAIMSQPINNNALLVVEKTVDALPVLSLLEQMKQVVNSNVKFVPIHIAHYVPFDPEQYCFEKRNKLKAGLNKLIYKTKMGNAVPVVMDMLPFYDEDSLSEKIDYLIAQPNPIIGIITKDKKNELHKKIINNNNYQPSFETLGIVVPKEVARFTTLEISPLSLNETRACLNNFLNLTLNPYNAVKFTDEAADLIISSGYEHFKPNETIVEIEKAFRMMSVSHSSTEPIGPAVVENYFKELLNPNLKQQEKLVNECEKTLNQKVLGQEEALHQITETILAKEFDLNPEKRPIVMGFFGPSGVGKTATAEALGPILSGKDSTIINMSEYQEDHTISKLISSPPGYIGSNNPGLLYEAVKDNPRVVLILDEFEKANPAIHKLFLGIFDKGIVHDSCKGDVDLSQAAIILTSNAGIKESQTMGFDEKAGQVSYDADEKAIEHSFPPEFMGRIQARILFKPLKDDTLDKIIEMQLEPIREKLNKQFDLGLKILPNARKQLLEAAKNPRYGARPLKNLIRSKISAPLSILLRQGKFGRNRTVCVDFDKEKQTYSFTEGFAVKAHYKQQVQIIVQQNECQKIKE